MVRPCGPAYISEVPRRVVLLCIAVAIAAARERPARACAACGCGDPTLTVMGTELPFRGRKRIATQFTGESITTGRAGIDEQRITDLRIDTSLSYTPVRWLTLSATLPIIHRDVDYVNLAHDAIVGTGDLEVRAKAFVYRDRRFAPRTLLAVIAGAQLPTGPQRNGPTGQPLSIDVQTGSGAVTPLAGLAIARFFDRWSVYGSVTESAPFEGVAHTKLGLMTKITAAVQWQPSMRYGFRLGVDAREEGVTLVNGMTLADSGGFIGFVSPAFVWAPVMDLLVQAEVRVPVVNALEGHQGNGTIVALSAAYDF